MISWIRTTLARIRASFTKRSLDRELSAELASHLELATEDNLRRGLPPDEARRQALVALGGIAQAQEQHRDARGIPGLEHLLQDLRFAGRLFRREPGFTASALGILAVGIALNITVFSLVNTAILRPLPFASPDRLVWITNGEPGTPRTELSTIASRVESWETLAKTNRSLDQIEAYNPFSARTTYRLTGGTEPETIFAIDVSPGLFGLLGVHPFMGRAFLPEDAVPNAPPRVLLAHALWRRRFASAPAIVGKTVEVNGTAVEVIGIMPAADRFASIFFPAARVDAYAPLRNDQARNWGNTVALVGRMKPGLTLAATQADLNIAIEQIRQQQPNRGRFRANAESLHRVVRQSMQRPLVFLWAAAGAVLAIVGLNVGGLLIARGAARSKELAVRCALGAGQGRIARQLFTECTLLVIIAAVIGTGLSWLGLHLLARRSGVEIPLLALVHLDLVAVAFTVALSLVTSCICGALPAWRLSRQANQNSRLVESSRGSSAGPAQNRLRNTLVVAEIALACALGVGAGLVLRSLLNVLRVDLGFEPRQLVAVRIDTSAADRPAYVRAILERVRAIPGVNAAGLTDCIPVERDRSWGLYPVVPDAPTERRFSDAHVRIVSPGLLHAMGIRLVAGNDFAAGDNPKSPRTIIINQTLASQLWPGQNAVGRQVVVGRAPATVIGVAANVHHSGPEVPPGREMYLSIEQLPESNSWDLMLRTALPPASLAVSLRQALREIDPTLPLTKIRPMTTVMAQTMSSRRLIAGLVGGFALIAAALAVLGLYGVIAYSVTQQRRDFGIRLALGAAPRTLERQVIGRTLRLAALGVALGLALAGFLGQAMRALLFQMSGFNLGTYATAAVVLFGCALAAAYLPARRAGRVNPLEILRSE